MEDFSLLENIAKNFIAQNPDSENFDWTKFVEAMEMGFTKLGFREPVNGAVDNVLAIKFSPTGDLITTTPAIRELRKKFSIRKNTFDDFRRYSTNGATLSLCKQSFGCGRSALAT